MGVVARAIVHARPSQRTLRLLSTAFFVNLFRMADPKDDLLLLELKTLRQVRLELEALKEMFFEHRPPFVQAFAHHSAAVEASGFLRPLDEAISAVQRRLSKELS